MKNNFGFYIVYAALIPMIIYAMNTPLIYCFFVAWAELVIALLFYYIVEVKHGALVFVHNTAMEQCGCLDRYHYAPELAVTFLEYKGWVFNFESGWYHPTKFPNSKLNWRAAYLEEFDNSYVHPSSNDTIN